MFASMSPFLDFNLPNSTTWFYFSFLLAVAIFFKFGRLFSIRNLDVLILFLLVPPIMVIQTSRTGPMEANENPAVHVAGLIGQGSVAGLSPAPASLGGVATFVYQRQESVDSSRWMWFGYLWLLIGTGVLFGRCLFDLILVQRPNLEPNLTVGGLCWFGIALIVCLTAVAFRQPERIAVAPKLQDGLPNPQRKTGPESAPYTEARRLIDPTDVMLRGAAVAGQLAVVLGLMLIGRLHFHDTTAGIAAAVFYLLLPYTGMFIREVDHVWPMAIIVWALVAYRWPSVSGLLLGLAAGPFYYPALLVPVFVSFYWRRGAWWFLLSFFLSMALVMGGVALAYHMRGELNESIRRALELASWQPWKTPPPDLEGFWTGIHAAYRIPVFIAYAAFVIATAFWPMPKDLGHVLALSSAILIGTQFWYADQGGIFVLWYLPLFLLMVFRPNLSDRRPRGRLELPRAFAASAAITTPVSTDGGMLENVMSPRPVTGRNLTE